MAELLVGQGILYSLNFLYFWFLKWIILLPSIIRMIQTNKQTTGGMGKVAESFGAHSLFSIKVYDPVRGAEQIDLDSMKWLSLVWSLCLFSNFFFLTIYFFTISFSLSACPFWPLGPCFYLEVIVLPKAFPCAPCASLRCDSFPKAICILMGHIPTCLTL